MTLSSILQPASLELETDQNVYKITLVWYNRYDHETLMLT